MPERSESWASSVTSGAFSVKFDLVFARCLDLGDGGELALAAQFRQGLVALDVIDHRPGR